jgi:hypothetical protein
MILIELKKVNIRIYFKIMMMKKMSSIEKKLHQVQIEKMNHLLKMMEKLKQTKKFMMMMMNNKSKSFNLQINIMKNS